MRFPRFAAFRSTPLPFLAEVENTYNDLYAWELGMMQYYIQKHKSCQNQETVIELLEYLMTVPDFLAWNYIVRESVVEKVKEFRYNLLYSSDCTWNHAVRSMEGFLHDLQYHPLYRIQRS